MYSVKDRNPTFDVAKALVMLLVVGGHLGNLVSNPSGWCEPYFSNSVIGVSMPLFFMMSGYFSVASIRNGSFGKVVARAIGFLWPLFAFGCVIGAIIGMVGTKPLWKVCWCPFVRVALGGWFLLTIAIIYSACAMLMRIGKTESQRWLCLMIFYACLFFAPSNGVFYWTGKCLHMVPYFVFGMLVLKPYELYRKAVVAIPAGLLFIAVVAFEGDCRENGMSFYFVPTAWRVVLSDWHLFLCFWLRTVVGITGSIFVLWLLDGACSKAAFMNRLAVFGTTTLGVYVMHEWPLVQMRGCSQFHGAIPYFLKWPVVLSIFLICHYVTLLIRKYRHASFVFFGNEKWLQELVDSRVKGIVSGEKS